VHYGSKRRKSKDYFGMYGMQAEKLRYVQEQKERYRKIRNAKVLQILQKAYHAQGSEISFSLFLLPAWQAKNLRGNRK
jgi:hypothetical protein